MASSKRAARPVTHHLGKPWCEALELPDGRRAILRPIQPVDAGLLQESFKQLTPEEIRFRFFRPLKGLSDDFARRLAEIDRDEALALVVVELKPPPEALIVAVARCSVLSEGDSAEFAIIVGKAWTRQGLATLLLKRLIEWCRRKRLKRLYGDVLDDNIAMLALADSLGFQRFHDPDDPEVVRVELPL